MKKPAKRKTKVAPPARPVWEWELRLYVAGTTSKSATAFHNIQKLCEEHLAGRYHLDVIDLVKDPQLAQADQILAVPTLVRTTPSPKRKVVGMLEDTGKVLHGLEMRQMKKISGTAPPEKKR